jgi:phosphate starvation-inducible PhoH-like protein
VLQTAELSPPEIPREKLVFDDPGATQTLIGQSNSNLKLIERETGAALHVRGNEVTIVGDAEQAALARTILEQLYGFAKRGTALVVEDIVRAS